MVKQTVGLGHDTVKQTVGLRHGETDSGTETW